MVKCHLCQKETEKINSRVNVGGEEIVSDHLFKNEYVIKKGLFSKSKVVFCTSCDENFEKLFSGSKTDGKINTAFNTLNPSAIAFMNENKDKIIQGDLSKVPKCPNCKSQSSQFRIVKCDECNKKFCDDCDPFDWDDAGDGAKGDKLIDYFIENYMNSNEMVCPLCYDKKVNNKIINLLKKKAVKISVSDIAAFLKFDRDFTKWQLDQMHKNKEIDFAGNGRYFILNPDKKKSKPKKGSAPKLETVDVKAELKKYKEMLDDGLIQQEDYDAKKKQLLGL